MVADGDRLRCRPKTALTTTDITVLKVHKAEVLASLRAEDTDAICQLLCYACRGHRFWRSVYDVIICVTCHPPAAPELVVEWMDASQETGGAR